MELAVGMVIMVLVSMVLIANLVTTYKGTHNLRDKIFAYSTAQSILAELHALADGFEVQIIGPSSGRQVCLHLIVVSRWARLPVTSSQKIIINTRDV